MDTAYNMFSKNLSKASILTYVYIMNVTDMDVEVDFLLGDEDKTHWTVSINYTNILLLILFGLLIFIFVLERSDRRNICSVTLDNVAENGCDRGNQECVVQRPFLLYFSNTEGQNSVDSDNVVDYF